MKNFFGFGAAPEIEIVMDGQEKRRTAEIKTEDGKKERHLLYYDGETVSGQVKIMLKKPGSKFEHQGIRVELIGQIEFYYDRGTQYTFLSLFKELARPGDLLPHQLFNFEFIKVEKPFESYTGANCKLRYFIRVSIAKRLSDIIKERDFVVHTLSQYPDMNSSIKMEVGIEDCLHIEFEYNRSKYHLKDVIVGKIYFLLVRIKIKHMELAIIKRETTGSGPNTFNENETIAKFEIMDGAPVKGESIPIRVFLAGYDLTPTFRDVNRKFSVRYYINLVLVDEEDRRYFKQQEIILWRKIDKPRKTFQAALQQQYREMQNPNVQFTPSDPIPGSSSTVSGIPPIKGSSDEERSNESESTGKTSSIGSNSCEFEQVDGSKVAMLEDVHQENVSENDVKAANGDYHPNYFSEEVKAGGDNKGKEREEDKSAQISDNVGPTPKTTLVIEAQNVSPEVASDAAAMIEAVALDGNRDEE